MSRKRNRRPGTPPIAAPDEEKDRTHPFEPAQEWGERPGYSESIGSGGKRLPIVNNRGYNANGPSDSPLRPYQ